MSIHKEPEKFSTRQLVLSYVVWAFVGLLVLDGGCRLLAGLGLWPYTAYDTAYRSGVWWASNEFNQKEKPAEVALLGSSLMMAAVHGGDATHLKTAQKVALHHKSALLESLINQRIDRQLSTYSFALGGEMASDAYVLTRTLLAGKKQPKVIIYGIAPRDFMDNALKDPASTEIFRYMSRINDLPDIAVPARSSIWSVVEYALSKASFLYGHRQDFVFAQHQITKDIVAHIGFKDMDNVHTTFEVRKQAFTELPEDSGPDEVKVHPPDAAPPIYTDNLPEYRYRYSSFKAKQFEEQLGYLEKLLAVGQQRGIKIILVNMPLTQDNLDLMPCGFYQKYKGRVEKLCTDYQARVIDLNSQQDFPKKYFADSAHLNSEGGAHFFEVLADKLFNDSQVCSTMKNIVPQ